MEDQFLSLLSFVAQQERNKTKQRQKEGISLAKTKGKHLGRPKMGLNTLSKNQHKILKEQYPKWKKGNIKGVQFMELLDVKKNTFYKIIREYEQNTKGS